jgi:hypothetical protein
MESSTPLNLKKKDGRKLPHNSRIFITLSSFLYREKGISPYSRAIKEARIMWKKHKPNQIELWLKQKMRNKR